MSVERSGGTDRRMERRIEFALSQGRSAVRWSSGRATDWPEDALRYHAGLVLMIAALEGTLDDYIGVGENDDDGV